MHHPGSPPVDSIPVGGSAGNLHCGPGHLLLPPQGRRFGEHHGRRQKLERYAHAGVVGRGNQHHLKSLPGSDPYRYCLRFRSSEGILAVDSQRVQRECSQARELGLPLGRNTHRPFLIGLKRGLVRFFRRRRERRREMSRGIVDCLAHKKVVSLISRVQAVQFQRRCFRK